MLLLFSLGADFVLALEINYPTLPNAEPPQSFLQRVHPNQAFPLYINYFFRLAIWILGFVAFGVIAYGGVLYLLSYGNPTNLSKAKELISSAFFGILILLTSYLVLSVISPDLISLEPFEVKEVKVEKIPDVPNPKILSANTSIHVELPIGRIIEGDIFETYISDPNSVPENTPRITRISTNAISTLDISKKLSQNSKQLDSLAQQCDCSQADPVCGWPPSCSPMGATPLTNILGPQGLLAYSSIMESLSDMLGPDNLSFALKLSESVAQGTGNIGELSGVLNSIDGLSQSLGLSQNFPKVFDIVGEISGITQNPQNLTGMVGSLNNLSQIVEVPANLSKAFSIATQVALIAENPENLGSILSSTENLTNILGVTSELGNTYNIGYNIASIVENPTQYSSLVGSVANITNMLGVPGDLSGVFSTAYDIASVAENPTNAVSVLNSNKDIARVLDSIGGSKRIEDVFNVGYNIALIAENPGEYSTMVGAASNIATILNAPGDLGETFNVAYNIASIAEEPENLSRTFASLESIGNIVGANAYLTPAFKTIRDLGAITENPADLDTVLSSSERIARRLSSSQDIPIAFDKAYEAISLSQSYQEYPELIESMGRLSNNFENSAHLEQILDIAQEKRNQTENTEELVRILEEDLNFIHVVPSENLVSTLEEIEKIAERTGNLTEVKRITIEMRSMTPYAGEVFQGVGSISRAVENPSDLRNISRVLKDFSFLSKDSREAAVLLEDFGEISAIARDMSGIENLEKLAMELTYITADHHGFTEALRSFQGVASAIKEPEDLRNMQRAMEDLSLIVPELGGISSVLNDFQGIGAVIQNPRDMRNIQTALTDLSQFFPEAREMSQFLGEYAGIASLIEDPTDFQNLQVATDSLSAVIPQLEDVSQYFENLQGIASFIQDPTDFQELQGALNDLSQVIPEAAELSQFLGEFKNLAAVIQDPTDLSNIQAGLNDLSQIIPEADKLSQFLGEYAGIAGLIQNPGDLSNIMAAASDLAAIAPELSPILGELASLGGLFGGPQAIIGAFSSGSCTCDTCASSRGEIERLQNENTDNLIPSLRQEQQKTIKEREDLQEALDRLERAADFTDNCPYNLKNSLSHFFPVKESYIANKSGIVRQFPFWDDIIIPYLTKQNETVSEWVSFLCLIGGNILSTQNPVGTLGNKEITLGAEACFNEIPLGDIVERTLRTGSLMTEKMQTLIELDRELISEVDKLHVLISKCTSQSPSCYSVCIPVFDDGDLVGCDEWCEGSACPYGEISEQAKKIQQILERKNGINFIIDNPKIVDKKGMQKKTPKEEIGLRSIIESIIPPILKDLQLKVRQPMLVCEPQHGGNLLPCNRSIGKTTPEKGLIEGCAREEDFFQPCLEKCYLKENMEEYNLCLQGCLLLQEQNYSGLEGSEKIPGYRHRLNFFCCSAQINE